MRGILIPLLVGGAVIYLATLLLRSRRFRHKARMLVAVYAAGAVMLIALHAAAPADPYLPASDTQGFASLLLSGFLYTAGFFGGVLQLYNLADRGLSLRMLIDVTVTYPDGLGAAEMVTKYAQGHGLRWMYAKRLEGMVGAGLARLEGHDIVVTPKGRTAARLLEPLKVYATGQRMGSGLWS